MPKKIVVTSKTAGQFGEALQHHNKPIIMLYHMDMCPHCIALRPTWNAVSTKLARNPGLVVAEIEYSQLEVLPPHLRQIHGFPTIQMLHRGKVWDEYFGDRSAKSITEYAESHVAPPATAPPAAPARKAAPAKKKAPKKTA